MYIYKGTKFAKAQDLADFIQQEDLGYMDSATSFRYVYRKYGRNYLKRFLEKKPIKRPIIEYPTENFEQLKNKNVKFHYLCKNCGREVFTTWYLINHFNDNLCKYCRKFTK